jgi:hypothetical protein
MLRYIFLDPTARDLCDDWAVRPPLTNPALTDKTLHFPWQSARRAALEVTSPACPTRRRSQASGAKCRHTAVATRRQSSRAPREGSQPGKWPDLQIRRETTHGVTDKTLRLLTKPCARTDKTLRFHCQNGCAQPSLSDSRET